MKKFITLALALVMVLGLAAPALAYTTNVAPAQGVSPYTVRIYMVEYANVDVFSGWITMPPSDRGYATNEVIAFVGELTVPAKRTVWNDWYRDIRFSAKNVSFNVTDNFSPLSGNLISSYYWLRNTMPTSAVGWSDNIGNQWSWDADSNNKLTAEFRLASAGAGLGTRFIPYADSQKVYKWLGFGKVTGDDATVTFALRRAAGFLPVSTDAASNTWNTNYVAGASGIIPANAADHNDVKISSYTHVLVLNEKYLVFKNTSAKDGPTAYYVYENAAQSFGAAFDADGLATTVMPETSIGDLLFKIETVNNIGKTARMWIYPRGVIGYSYRIHVEPSVAYLDVIVNGETGFLPANSKVGDQVDPTSSAYKSAVDFYNEYVVDAFGFDAWNRGNLLVDSDWGKIANAAWDISDTVDVEPWTPYVAVPENIVTDPPKTGDASVLGFVMIVLAAAAAVVVKKVRA